MSIRTVTPREALPYPLFVGFGMRRGIFLPAGRRWRVLKAIKKLNNNFALCLDSSGVEMIAYGRGIGFGQFPCEVDLEKLDGTYYNVDPQLMGMIAEMDDRLFHISGQVIRFAQQITGKPIPNNFVFSLTDHIQFAIERQKKNIHVKMPFAYEIEHLYEKEFRIGTFALKRLKEELKVFLPKEEATGIALHFINNYQQYSAETATTEFEDLLEQVLVMIEDHQGLTLDRSSYDCYRFSMHLRYFMKRAGEGVLYTGAGEDELYQHMKADYPDIYETMTTIQGYLETALHIHCSTEEQLYLMIHINRLCTKEDCHRQ